MSNVRELKQKTDPELLQRAEDLKALVESGEVTGFLILVNGPGGYVNAGFAGELDLGTMLVAFEDWKHTVWSKRHE